MINYVEGEVKSRLNKDGILYILFDPVSYSDLGESKNFYYSINERKKILSDYKANRTYSPIYLETIELFRKYYLYRGDSIKLLYSDEYEADDYVEPLIAQIKDGWKFMSTCKNVALITTDYDFAGYIHDKPNVIVHMINGDFDKPFTVSQFEQLFQFKPTIAANILYKALFGDKSDNIVGTLLMKKAKFGNNIKVLCRDYLQQVADSNVTIDEVIQQFKDANFQSVNKKEDRDAFDLLYLSLSLVDLKVPVFQTLFTNIRVIRSALSGKSLEPYMHCNAENNVINDVVYKSIYGIPYKQLFGRT